MQVKLNQRLLVVFSSSPPMWCSPLFMTLPSMSKRAEGPVTYLGNNVYWRYCKVRGENRNALSRFTRRPLHVNESDGVPYFGDGLSHEIDDTVLCRAYFLNRCSLRFWFMSDTAHLANMWWGCVNFTNFPLAAHNSHQTLQSSVFFLKGEVKER